MAKRTGGTQSQIFVYRTESGYAVSPGTFILYRSAGPPQLRNHTDERLQVSFGQLRVPVRRAGRIRRPGRVFQFTVPPGGVVVLDGLDRLRANVYTYDVMVGGFHAIGNSPPRVIVDP